MLQGADLPAGIVLVNVQSQPHGMSAEQTWTFWTESVTAVHQHLVSRSSSQVQSGPSFIEFDDTPRSGTLTRMQLFTESVVQFASRELGLAGVPALVRGHAYAEYSPDTVQAAAHLLTKECPTPQEYNAR